MAYADHFKLADDLVAHLKGTVGALGDPFLESRYAGFVAVVAVAVYELAIKDIFVGFAEKKNTAFGVFVRKHFDRISGRIKTDTIRHEYVPSFGARYERRYKLRESELERDYLRNHGKSVLSAYNNLIQWRHTFAHEGQVPSTATFNEVVDAYEVGKEVIHCLDMVMRR